MALAGKAFDDIVESDLNDLVANGVPEGLLLEYKRQIYGGDNDAKKEFLKDISAMANASGGHLLVGLPETGGVPSSPMPFLGDADAEILRMENLARDGLQPRIVGLRMRAVQMTAGGACFVIRIPKSWNGPHRVAFQGTNRFYMRNSGGTHELSIDELRVAFTASATAVERAQAFRSERVARIDAGDSIEPLNPGTGVLVLHVIPLAAFASANSVDVDLARSISGNFAPIGATGMRPRLNFDGFINIDVPGTAYTQVFRNGVIEATTTYLVGNWQERRVVSAPDTENQVTDALGRYLSGLSRLDVPFPMVIGVSLLGVKGSIVILNENTRFFHNPESVDRHQLDLPVVVLEDAPQDRAQWRRTLRPIFDALANASGLSRMDMFDESGNWVQR